jgi:biopolymer transport protein ExbD
MRTPSSFLRQRGDHDTKMTPMIDVVFLLLVFFVWTASFHVAEHLLPSHVSTLAGTQVSSPQTPPPEQDFDDIVIRIQDRGGQPSWTINGSPAGDLQSVRATLASIAQVKPDAPIILHPDGQIPLGDVIDVYDVCRLLGYERVQFSASEKVL